MRALQQLLNRKALELQLGDIICWEESKRCWERGAIADMPTAAEPMFVVQQIKDGELRFRHLPQHKAMPYQSSEGRRVFA